MCKRCERVWVSKMSLSRAAPEPVTDSDWEERENRMDGWMDGS